MTCSRCGTETKRLLRRQRWGFRLWRLGVSWLDDGICAECYEATTW